MINKISNYAGLALLYLFAVMPHGLMKILARACGHEHLNEFNREDIATWSKEIAELTGIPYSGFDTSR